MSARRTRRAHRATALVPLALLSAAWTASLAGVGGGTTVATVSAEEQPRLPDGTSVPTEAIQAPASVSSTAGLAPGVGRAEAARVVSTASTSGIPSAALAAYQRAETVINSADKSCNLTWHLVAAIGRVESDHGRYGGNTLDDQGVATPGIYGIPLNGKRNTQAISDTDAGQYDNDLVWDRAVGPMQFIPSTWSVVGVDADGDKLRNPQDIDDAALATAVYLCSGNDDLSTEAGQRASVFRYNHSESYVDLVLSIMNAYLAGDFMPVPNGSTSATYFVPDPDFQVEIPGGGSGGGGGNAPDDDEQVLAAPSAPDTEEEAPAPENDAPIAPAPTPGGGGGGGTSNGPVPSVPVPTATSVPSTGVTPVDDVLTLAQAIAKCTAEGKVDDPLDDDDAFDRCVKDYTS